MCLFMTWCILFCMSQSVLLVCVPCLPTMWDALLSSLVDFHCGISQLLHTFTFTYHPKKCFYGGKSKNVSQFCLSSWILKLFLALWWHCSVVWYKNAWRGSWVWLLLERFYFLFPALLVTSLMLHDKRDINLSCRQHFLSSFVCFILQEENEDVYSSLF